MKEEFLDIVNEDDEIIGTASWNEMMEKKLLHRTSNVFIFNSEGELFIHKRAEHLKLYPGLYDVKVGGSVRSGETYEEAAKRELFEEVGIKAAKLTELFKLKSRKKENKVNRTVFKCVYDGKITIDKSEVEEGKFMSLNDLQKIVHEGKFSPSAVDVLNEYLKNVKKN